MAEGIVAPAVPSQSAQPTAQPSTGAPSTSDSVPIVAKPIKSAPAQLPGVFPDADPFPSPPSGSVDSAGTPRGPDGRFVAGTSPASPGSGEHTLEPSASEPAPATKYKFGGEEFASQAEAEQNFKSLRGQFKPIATLARSLGGVDKIIPQFTQAAESARGWKGEHDRVKAELEALRSGAKPADAAVPQEAKAAEADVDWQLYAEVKKLATESGEPWKAEQWLIEQVRKADAARYKQMLDERMAPLDQQQETQAVTARTETLFESMTGYTNPDGSPAFPELSNADAAYEVGRLWASLGLPKEAALTPQGAMAAIALYRMSRGNGSQATLAPSTAPAAPAAPPQPTDTQSAAGMVDGKPLVASAPGNGSMPSAEAARILAGLRQSHSGTRSHLGFDA